MFTTIRREKRGKTLGAEAEDLGEASLRRNGKPGRNEGQWLFVGK